ncbi:MAG TPA: hypothetical protein VHN37_12195 [Actinomycetota bacterium]|nr:hypothetical protein [Actinomycetota bacterium]
MRKSLARVLTASAIVIGALGWASPAMAACTSQVVPSLTVGALGQDLATTPQIGVSWCGESRYFTGAPTVTVETYHPDSYAVYLDFPSGGPKIDWTFTVQVGDTTRSVRVPVVEPAPTGRICLAFVGHAYHNPGTCLAHVERP